MRCRTANCVHAYDAHCKRMQEGTVHDNLLLQSTLCYMLSCFRHYIMCFVLHILLIRLLSIETSIHPNSTFAQVKIPNHPKDST